MGIGRIEVSFKFSFCKINESRVSNRNILFLHNPISAELISNTDIKTINLPQIKEREIKGLYKCVEMTGRVTYLMSI